MQAGEGRDEGLYSFHNFIVSTAVASPKGSLRPYGSGFAVYHSSHRVVIISSTHGRKSKQAATAPSYPTLRIVCVLLMYRKMTFWLAIRSNYIPNQRIVQHNNTNHLRLLLWQISCLLLMKRYFSTQKCIFRQKGGKPRWDGAEAWTITRSDRGRCQVAECLQSSPVVHRWREDKNTTRHWFRPYVSAMSLLRGTSLLKSAMLFIVFTEVGESRVRLLKDSTVIEARFSRSKCTLLNCERNSQL